MVSHVKRIRTMLIIGFFGLGLAASSACMAEEAGSARADSPICRAKLQVSPVEGAKHPETSNGSVAWSIAVSGAAAHEFAIGAQAEVYIPELKLHTTMVLRKNFDPQLHASHTVQLRFKFDPASQMPAIRDIAMPIMRSENPPAAAELMGTWIRGLDNEFIVGLDAETASARHNVEAIIKQDWFDIPLQISKDRSGSISFDKCNTGSMIIQSVL